MVDVFIAAELEHRSVDMAVGGITLRPFWRLCDHLIDGALSLWTGARWMKSCWVAEAAKTAMLRAWPRCCPVCRKTWGRTARGRASGLEAIGQAARAIAGG